MIEGQSKATKLVSTYGRTGEPRKGVMVRKSMCPQYSLIKE